MSKGHNEINDNFLLEMDQISDSKTFNVVLHASGLFWTVFQNLPVSILDTANYWIS